MGCFVTDKELGCTQRFVASKMEQNQNVDRSAQHFVAQLCVHISTLFYNAIPWSIFARSDILIW